MWTRLKQLIGGAPDHVVPVPATAATAAAPGMTARASAASAPSRREAARREADAEQPAPLLPARLVEFVDILSAPPDLPEAETLDTHDVLFLEGLVRRLQSAQIEVAILPAATLRLTEMLRHGDVPIARYAELINQDSALSMEVIKAANSAFYGSAMRTTTLQDAVMRIGLTRLQSILMLALMKTRVLKAGTLRAHAELLMEMALPIASCASALARACGGPADMCFMRGMLLHVEHLMVLGTIGDTSREHRAVITPSTGALMLAFDRAGVDVRRALAYSWSLEDILVREDGDPDPIDYDLVRRAVICRWLRRPLPVMNGVGEAVLLDALSSVLPRVPERPEVLTHGDAGS